jgi:hypothetical protein
MPEEKARKTVVFAAPVKGAAIIEAVREIASEDTGPYGTRFISQNNYDKGQICIVGQTSGYAYKHLVITPTVDSKGIRPSASYDEVQVVSHSWAGLRFMVGYDSRDVIRSVRTFADKLNTRFLVPVDSSTESVWPQEVEVCAICECLVTRYNEQARCPEHGENSPTLTIKVTPVAD